MYWERLVRSFCNTLVEQLQMRLVVMTLIKSNMFGGQPFAQSQGEQVSCGPLANPNHIKENSIAYRQDTSKREGAQPVNQLANHAVIQKPPILHATCFT